MMHLLDRPDAYPYELSGGMKQRTALGRSLATNFQVLLLDEPLRALDARLRIELRNELLKLTRDLGLTVLHVTHDQEEAMSVADRLVILHKGRILQIGTQEEIYLYPKNDFVCSFLGETISLTAQVINIEKYSEGQIKKLFPLFNKDFYCYYFESKNGNITKKLEIINPNVFAIGDEVQLIVKTENIRLTKIDDFNKKMYKLDSKKNLVEASESSTNGSTTTTALVLDSQSVDLSNADLTIPDLGLMTNTFWGKIIHSYYLGKWTDFEIQMQDVSTIWKAKLTSRKAIRFKIGDLVVLQFLKEFVYAFKK